MNHFVKYARWYWIAWALIAFLPVELYAVFNHVPGDTFSENWWQLFGILGHVPAWWHVAGVAVTLITGVWLTGHLAFGWWGGPNKPHLPTGTLRRVEREMPNPPRDVVGAIAPVYYQMGVRATLDTIKKLERP